MLNAVRIFLYVVLWLLAATLLGLSAARIHYTLHLPWNDPLNGGRNFYDPIIAELIATTCFTLLWIPYIIRTIHHRHEHSVFHTFIHELVGLAVLLILYVVGAGVSTHYWGDLNWCWKSYHACRLLTVLVGFAWASTIVAGLILLVSFMWVAIHRAWTQPMHGRAKERRTWFGR